MAERSRARVPAGALLAGAALWLLAGVLIVWQPAGAPAGDTYSTLVPAALLLLAVGFGGIDALLAGPRAGDRRSRRGGLGRSVLAMSSGRHEAISASAGDYAGESGRSARRAGLQSLRAGSVAVAVASLVLQGEVGALRSLLFFGWFLFFAGAIVLGVAVVASETAPRRAGALLLAGCLLVFSVVATVLGGVARRPEMLGPLLPSTDGGAVPSLVPWLLFGAGCASLGVWLWSARPHSGRTSA